MQQYIVDHISTVEGLLHDVVRVGLSATAGDYTYHNMVQVVVRLSYNARGSSSTIVGDRRCAIGAHRMSSLCNLGPYIRSAP